MAEPIRKPTALDDGAPRTARARSERDLGGRSKRPPRGQRSSRKPSSKSSVDAAGPEPRTRSTGGERSRPTRGSRSGSPQRPRNVKAGSGARVLAPLALVVFAIACFVVVTGQSSNGNTTANSAKTSTKAAAAAAATTGPTRSTYRVKAGDSFAAIAEKQGIDVNKLQELNPDIDPRALQPGQKLKLK